MDSSVRLLAFDPSLINLGFSCGVSDGKRLLVENAQTFKIDQLITSLGSTNVWERELNLERMQHTMRVVDYTLKVFKPDIVVLEDPIYNKRNPDSLITQSRCLGIIEQRIAEYYLGINKLPSHANYKPNVIKQAVGVPRGRFKEKEAITECLLELMVQDKLAYLNDEHKPDCVDDHANDSVAMLYTKHLEVCNVLV